MKSAPTRRILSWAPLAPGCADGSVPQGVRSWELPPDSATKITAPSSAVTYIEICLPNVLLPGLLLLEGCGDLVEDRPILVLAGVKQDPLGHVVEVGGRLVNLFPFLSYLEMYQLMWRHNYPAKPGGTSRLFQCIAFYVPCILNWTLATTTWRNLLAFSVDIDVIICTSE